MSNQKFRNQVADLILKDEDGKDLVIVSEIEQNQDGSMYFLAGKDSPSGVRYKVTIQIEEV